MLFKKVFEKIYESKINCRLEWLWDGGFSWSIKNPINENDSIEKGNSSTIDGAFYDMISAIEKHFPNSKFVEWVKDYNENMEHFMICVGCGDLVDKRNLGEVLEHEHDNEIPIIDKTKKYIAQQEGDNKAWLDGKPINLN